MDLIFKKYSSPFFYIQNLLDMGAFSEGIENIFEKANDEKLWELYLHTMPTKSFSDWKKEHIKKINVPKVSSKKQIEAAKNGAENILKNFKPY